MEPQAIRPRMQHQLQITSLQDQTEGGLSGDGRTEGEKINSHLRLHDSVNFAANACLALVGNAGASHDSTSGQKREAESKPAAAAVTPTTTDSGVSHRTPGCSADRRLEGTGNYTHHPCASRRQDFPCLF